MERFFNMAIWAAGGGHFCILAASFQVPGRLGWRKDLAKLSPFNRKLMWTYGGFTAGTIIIFGILTLVLHEELLRGDRSAVALAAFIGFYWAARVGVDFLYFSHEDWPAGKGFAMGHVLLTSLFIALAGTYLGLTAWHVWGR